MTIEYDIALYDPFGVRLPMPDVALNFQYRRTVNAVGTLDIALPPSVPASYLRRDGRFGVFRQVPGRSAALLDSTMWLIRRTERVLSDRGEEYVRVTCVDGVDLLRRRIVAAAAGSSAATKQLIAADTMITAYVTENCGTSASAARQWPTGMFRVDTAGGVSTPVGKAASWRNLLTTIQEIADAVTQGGSYLAFDVVWDGTGYVFRTYPLWRGVDRRYPGGSAPLLLSPEAGALGATALTDDALEEVTYAYAGGQGAGSERTIGEYGDSTRIAASPFGRMEVFRDARNTDDATSIATITNEAETAVRQGRPRTLFATTLLQTDAARYGVNYQFGDVLTVEAFGVLYDCRLDSIEVSVQAGEETIGARLRTLV